MILTRKIACPACRVGLKIADSLPAGKAIECPKCGKSFRVPGANGAAATSAPPDRPRKVAPPPDEDEDDVPEEPRPRPRKKKLRKKQPASNLPLILGIVGGVVLLLGGGVAAAFIWKPWEKKTESVADSTPRRNSANDGAPTGPSDSDQRGERRPSGQAPGSSGQGGGRSAAGSGGDQFAAARNLFDMHCANCHSMGDGGGGGGGRGRSRGPSLAAIGRDPNHTADWLAKFIANPKSVKPNTRGMPSFGDKMEATDIRALAQYLATLK